MTFDQVMAMQVCTLTLIREDSSTPWGFRLEGGVDLGHPLNIQQITPGSVADRAGVRAGDLILKINKSDTYNMRHEDAKMEIIRSCNDFELLVERRPGGYHPPPVTSVVIQPMNVRKVHAPAPPKPTPMVHRPAIVSPSFANPSVPTKAIPSAVISHNVNPLPFGQSVPAPGESMFNQTADGRMQRIMHNDYNTPMGLYSKNNVNATFGNTLASAGNSNAAPPKVTNSSACMRCGACANTIKGVFVKVNNAVPMHPECLKCCKCGVGLRNIGYFYINDMLYCDVHARQAAQPPSHGMKPVAIYK